MSKNSDKYYSDPVSSALTSTAVSLLSLVGCVVLIILSVFGIVAIRWLLAASIVYWVISLTVALIRLGGALQDPNAVIDTSKPKGATAEDIR